MRNVFYNTRHSDGSTFIGPSRDFTSYHYKYFNTEINNYNLIRLNYIFIVTQFLLVKIGYFGLKFLDVKCYGSYTIDSLFIKLNVMMRFSQFASA